MDGFLKQNIRFVTNFKSQMALNTLHKFGTYNANKKKRGEIIEKYKYEKLEGLG